MGNEKDIAREVKRLKATSGIGYDDIRHIIKGKYNVELDPRDVDRYASMNLEQSVKNHLDSDAHATSRTQPYTRMPKKRSKAKIVTFSLLGTAALVFLTGYFLPRYIDYKSEKDVELEVKQKREAAAQNPLHNYIIFEKGNLYVVDIDQDKKPDGLLAESMLKAAQSIIKMDGKIKADVLLQSLFGVDADKITVKSTEQIIMSSGKPPQFTVYRIGNSRLSVNSELNEAWNKVNRQILDAFASNASVDKKKESVENAFRSSPEAAALTLNGLTNGEMERYLRDAAGMEITNMYSGIVRENFSNAARDAAMLNISGAVGNAFAAWFNTQMAKAAVQGMSGGTPSSSDSGSKPRPGLSGYYEYTDPRSGTVHRFSTPEERDAQKRYSEQMWNNWDKKK